MSKSTKTLSDKDFQISLNNLLVNTDNASTSDLKAVEDERTTKEQLMKIMLNAQIGRFDAEGSEIALYIVSDIRYRKDFESLLEDEKFANRFVSLQVKIRFEILEYQIEQMYDVLGVYEKHQEYEAKQLEECRQRNKLADAKAKSKSKK